MLSLLDVANKATTSWYVVYCNTDNPRWWNQRLKPGFQHVQVWRPIKFGPNVSDTVWVFVDPYFELLHVNVSFMAEPPWVRDPSITVQKVSVARQRSVVREWCFFGPVSCVEIVKACLGIKSFWLRTPWQLYKYIGARNGVLVSR